jgi:hypothetical protein
MKPLTPVAHREAAERPAGHGRVVEVHRRRGAGLTYDLLIILWTPAIGVHTHVMKLGASKAEATTAARHIAHR